MMLEVKNVSKEYSGALILDNISLSVDKEEFLSIVGPSGCGKSTLLRILTGLEKPSSGVVTFYDKPIEVSNPKISMVFQNFALFPWLTVRQNIELGLEAHGIKEPQRSGFVSKYVKIVGLEGAEDAYPKELSGGMKQRVGIARALAVEPDLLCMDEPFSSLDTLTAANLREEVLELWASKEFSPSSVVMVTHNIEEAVYMADRVIVLSRSPGRLIAQLKISLERPRNLKSEEFLADVDKAYSLIT